MFLEPFIYKYRKKNGQESLSNEFIEVMKKYLSKDFYEKTSINSKEERDKIFDQFYRIGSEDTRASKGTGLGLYIVNQIVEAHKGKIKVMNNDGIGTKIITTL